MKFNVFSKTAVNPADIAQQTLDAISRSQAVIEFAMDGTVLAANANFLAVLGYSLQDIVGKHHRMFVEPGYAASAEYQAFWDKLRSGRHDAAEYKRIGNGGREVWIQATYNPVLDKAGRPLKVIKFATDVTARKLSEADVAGQIAAIGKSQAVIEFDLSGTILTANENFCNALGYHLDEIKGRHHSMFVTKADAASPQYGAFWDALRAGRFQSAEYLRIGKGGTEVWIQATYNPILDMNGKPFKVVKFATDVTARKLAAQAIGEGLARVARGDLDCILAEPFEGDLEATRRAFNDTVTQFADIVGKLRTTAGSLRTATGEILSGANDLADRTTKQAAAIEETSAAVEQISLTVTENAKRAESTNLATRQVSTITEEAGQVMVRSNEAMERISTSSTKISNIIGMIDDIAFQTNLLALNASVEAARAGDAGKGFAVVAVEVRRLAQSAAQASSEVKTLIEQSANEVKAGTHLVAEATTKLGAMLEGVRKSAALVEEIAGASQSQASSISEVATAVRQMDEMTQHNAALVEETNAAVEQTEGQAKELDDIVGIFILAESAAPRATRSDARPARAAKSAEPARSPHAAARPAAKIAATARSYLAAGNAAVNADWSEF